MSEPELQRTSPWWFRLLPAATFVVGLLLGGLVTWVGSGTDRLSSDDSGSDPTPTQASTPPPAEPTSSAPQACLDASDAVEEAVRLMRRGAAATRDFQPDRLVDVLNQLETLDPRLRALAERCSGVAS